MSDGMAFQAHEHGPERWHGYPVGWNEVDSAIVTRWINERRVTRRQVRELWDLDEADLVRLEQD